ncbi:ArsR/SmtB family transcription factor [Streptosporangium sp. NPDC000396]|uniref:ArsR/SmtB family transcription factor n=1 Tax=Streptosporangium sp. NPDC000396 TaxID=3366185 RepID=UPI0036B50EFD
MRLPQPATEDIQLVDVLHALADPIRLEAVIRLANEGEHTCAQVGESIGVHKSTMSYHYRILREAGITTTRQEGRTKHMSLRRDDLDSRFPGLLDVVLTGVTSSADR